MRLRGSRRRTPATPCSSRSSRGLHARRHASRRSAAARELRGGDHDPVAHMLDSRVLCGCLSCPRPKTGAGLSVSLIPGAGLHGTDLPETPFRARPGHKSDMPTNRQHGCRERRLPRIIDPSLLIAQIPVARDSAAMGKPANESEEGGGRRVHDISTSPALCYVALLLSWTPRRA